MAPRTPKALSPKPITASPTRPVTNRDRNLPRLTNPGVGGAKALGITKTYGVKSWTAAPPSSPDNSLDAVVDAFERYGQDPAFANDLSRRWWATLSSPEIAASVYSEISGYRAPDLDYSDAVLESMYGQVAGVMEQELVDRVLESHPLVADFWSRRGNEFRGIEKDTMFLALASVAPERRDRLVALAEQFLTNSPLATEEDRINFVVWFYEQGRQQQAEQHYNASGIGRLGEGIAQPFHYVTEQVKLGYLNLISSPEEYKWRKPMSLGQNLAVTLGVDPSDEEAWNNVSGSFDFLSNFILDPVNWVANFAIGAKLARTVPAVGRFDDVSRLVRMSHAVVPWHGRVVTTLPRFSRSPLARLGWAAFSRSSDEILTNARKGGVFRDIVALRRTGGGAAEIVERYPQLRNTMDGFMGMLLSPKVLEGSVEQGEKWVEQVFRGSFYATFDSASKETLMALAGTDLKDAEIAYSTLKERALTEGRIDPKTLMGMDEDIARHVDYGAAVYEVRVGGFGPSHLVSDWSEGRSLVGSLVTTRGADAPKGAYVVLRGGGVVKTFDLADTARMADFRGWLLRHPGRPGVADGIVGVIDNLIRIHGAVPELPMLLYRSLQDDPAALNAMFRFMDARGIDIIGTAQSGILTPRGANRAIRGIDTPQAEAAMTVLRDAKHRVIQAERRAKQLGAGGGRTWFIKDMPTHPPAMQFIKGAWRAHGTAASARGVDGWWRNFRRKTSTFFFNPKNPGVVEITRAEVGSRSLGTFLRRFGVDKEFANSWVNRFVDALPEERADVVADALEAAAEKVDHPMLSYGIIERVKKEGLRAYAFDSQGMEILTAPGRAKRAGMRIALPIMPSQTTAFVQLPGQELFTSMRRYHRAQGAMPSLRRGIAPGTRSRRAGLVRQYGNIIARATGQDLADVDKDMLAAMAYATTRPYRRVDLATGKLERIKRAEWEDGLGLFAQVGMANNRAYSAYHSLFSIMQLAGRPISWAMRVLLEEQWRAGLFDLPSLFRNPIRALGGWYDAYFVSRHTAWLGEQIKFTRQIVSNVFDGLPRAATPEQALGAIKRVVPEFESLVTKALPSSVPELRTLFGRVLHNQVVKKNNLAIVNPAVTPARLARLRSSEITIAESRMRAIGLRTDFKWDDLPEIRNKGFTQLLIEEAAAGTYPVEWGAGRMTKTGLYNYGTAYSRILHQAVQDPVFGRFGLGRIVERAGHGPMEAVWTAERLVRDEAWLTMRPIVKRAVDGLGLPIRSDVELARWYLREVVDPQVTRLFGPILGHDLDEAARVASQILDTKRAGFTVSGHHYSFDFDSGNLHWLAKEVREFAANVHGDDSIEMPFRLAAFFEARFLGEDSKIVRQPWTKRTVRHIMGFFGDSSSQGINRRPAYLSAYRDHFRHYKAAGFTDAQARIAADMKSAELVNYVFYSLDNVVPALRKMNKVSPFFSAWWEVAQTWAYKIPMMSAWGVGYANMVRKIDRAIEALVKVGVLQVGEADPNSPTGTRNLRLVFSSDPSTRNPLGRTLSRTGYQMWRSPAIAIEHLTNIRNWFGDPLHDANDTWRDKGTISLSVGVPLDPFSHGLGAVNQAYVGTNPLVGAVASYALNRLPESVDYRRERALEGESLAAMAERLGVNPSEFIIANNATLLEALGTEEANRLFARLLDPSNVTLPAGTSLKVPKTNLWMTVMEDLLLPMGRLETGSGPIWNVAPGWMQQILSGFGLWLGGAGSGDPDESGTITQIGAGFINLMQSPQTRAAVAGEVLTQIQYLESTEGLLTRILEAERLVQETRERAKGELIEEVLPGGTIRVVNADHELAAELHARLEVAQALSDELLHRATSNAAGTLFMRGLMGFYSPGVPQMVYEQNVELATYYYGRELSEARASGAIDPEQGLILPPLRVGGEENYQAFLTLMQGWLADPSGDRNRQFLHDNFPEMWVFTFGKSYWEPGGEPPEITDMDEYARQIAAGTREAYEPSVFMQRLLRSQLRMEQEVDIRNRWGASGGDQAQNILLDWSAYSDWKKEYDIKRAALDEADDLYFNGEYQDFLNRNSDDNLTLLRYLNDWVNNVGEVLDELGDPTTNVLMLFDGEERRQFAGQLKQIARTLRSAVYDWRNDFGPTYEPNERDRVLSAYFSGPIASYYEGLGNLYDAVDAATDSEARSRIYEQILAYENQAGLAPALIEGVNLPSPLEWRWAAMPQDDRDTQVQRWMAARPDWLSLWATTHLTAEHPDLRGYLPTSLDDFEVYREYGQMLNQLAEMVEPGPNGEPPLLTSGQRNRASTAVKNWLTTQLVSQGRSLETVWADMTPIQRLDRAGVLPASLVEFVPMVNAVLDALAVAEKSPSTAEGRQLFAYILGTLEERSVFNPQIMADFEDLGMLLFEDRAHDSLIMKLFAGETFDASEL